MKGISAWLAACLVAAATAGCGTVQASHPGSAARTPASATVASPRHTSASPGRTPVVPASGPATAVALPACHGLVPTAHRLVLTLASNEKTYCVRVGDTLSVYLGDAGSAVWLRPVASGGALTPIPVAAAPATGVTSASFAAIRPGQAIVTSIRSPCRLAFAHRLDVEPADPLPAVYPVLLCPPGQGFSTSIIVRP